MHLRPLQKRFPLLYPTSYSNRVEQLRETWLWYDREHGVYYYSVKSSRDIGRDGRTQITFDPDVSPRLLPVYQRVIKYIQLWNLHDV